MKRAVLMLLCVASTAHARDRTYCVGGYGGSPAHAVAACNQPEVTRLHTKWHLHTWLSDGSACFICYDELDTSCINDFIKTHVGWAVRDPRTCPPDLSETGAHHVLEHVIEGQPAAPPPPPIALPPPIDAGPPPAAPPSPGVAPPVAPPPTPLELHLPPALDFGTVLAGTATLDACRPLDFSASRGTAGQGWRVQSTGLGACQARPMLAYRGALGAIELRPLDPPVELDGLDPHHAVLDVCLAVPRCAGEVAPSDAAVVVTPRSTEYASQSARVALHWTVSGRSWWLCSVWWLGPLVAMLAFLWLVAGFVRPVRFSPTASIRIAGSEAGLRTSPATLLIDFPGSSTGFYRNARLGLRGDGTLSGVLRHAPVILAAQRGGCVLRGPGPIEQQDRRTLKWQSVENVSTGHVPSGGTVYRSGSTYFRVEPE